MKNLTWFFRYSAVSSKRKFNLRQKKQNSSITEGYRDVFLVNLFGSCLNTFLAARGVRSENSAGGLEPEVSAPTGCLTITQATTISRLVPGLSSLDGRREEKGEAVLSDPPPPAAHGAVEGTADGGVSFLAVHQPLKDTVK